MKIKLDENLPGSAAQSLRLMGHDVDTVVDEGLAGAADGAVLVAAGREARLLFTMDRGFGDVRTYPPATHGGILVIRVDDQAPRSVAKVVAQIASSVDLTKLAGSVSVWRDGALRVRRATSDSGGE